MKNTAFIASMLLLITLARAEWEFLTNAEDMHLIQTDGSRLFATFERGLYTSHDQGNTWCTTALRPGGVGAIAVSGDTIYASLYKHGIFRSDDYGKTWTPKNNGLHVIDDDTGAPLILSIDQILVTRSGMVLAVGGFPGVYVSRDQGETWRFPSDWSYPCPAAPEYDRPISLDLELMAEYDGYWWAGNWTNDLYRSPDNGATWECLGDEPLRAVGTPRDWIVFDNQLYFAGSFGTHGVARWSEAELALEPVSDGLPRDRPPNLTVYVNSLAVNRGRIFAGLSAGLSGGVYMFNPETETWIPVGLNGSSVLSLISHQSDLYASTGRRHLPRLNTDHAFLRQNPDHLGRHKNKMKYATLIAFMLLAISLAQAEWEFLANAEDMRLLKTDGSRLFARFERGLYTSHDQGNTWCTTALRPGWVETIAISGDTIYASLYKQGIFRSDDFGETWTPKKQRATHN